jgi:hypothetical protein
MSHRPTYRLAFPLALAVLALAFLAPAQAQFAAPPGGTQVLDTSALKPPAGARVAIVEFDDLQCPACATANPILMKAAATYHIPWIRHDFLIPYHTWSLTAAITARYFDSKSAALGDAYRNEVFANQSYIYNPMMLRQFNSTFAQNHGVALPSDMDPQGKFAAQVQADNELSKNTGLHHTPTIFVVAAHSKGAPFIEVLHPAQDLDQIIEQALVDTTPAQTANSSKTGHK